MPEGSDNLTYEKLRRLREAQVAAARKYEGLSPVDEESGSAVGADEVRPLDQRVQGREKLTVGLCLTLCVVMIVWGTVSGHWHHYHHHPTNHHHIHPQHHNSVVAAVEVLVNQSASIGLDDG